ncbi:MAG: hypothetical protein ABIU96_12465 [Rhodanobacter sp.]
MTRPAITYDDLADALVWVSAGGFDEPQAWVCRDTGKIHYGSNSDDGGEDLPDDIDDAARYLALPDKRDLDLGNALALQFAREQLPDQYHDVRDIFHQKHAYERYKTMLARHDKLAAWFAYEERATESALRQWCADNELSLAD